MLSLNLLDDYSKSSRSHAENYYDIEADPLKAICVNRSSNQIQKNKARRARSEISLNLFERLIDKRQNETCMDLLMIVSRSKSNLSIGDHLPQLKQLDMNSCKSYLKYKHEESEYLSKKIHLLALNSSCSPLHDNKPSESFAGSFGDSVDSSNEKTNDANGCVLSHTSWKRLGAKSFHNLHVSSEFVQEQFYSNNPMALGCESRVPGGDECGRAFSSGLLVSSLARRMQCDDLSNFKKTLECVQMLSRKKKFSQKSKSAPHTNQ